MHDLVLKTAYVVARDLVTLLQVTLRPIDIVTDTINAKTTDIIISTTSNNPRKFILQLQIAIYFIQTL